MFKTIGLVVLLGFVVGCHAKYQDETCQRFCEHSGMSTESASPFGAARLYNSDEGLVCYCYGLAIEREVEE